MEVDLSGGGGTFPPARLASDSPIAIACFGLVTFLPPLPERSFPCFIAFISRSTDFVALALYFFFADDVVATFVVFFVAAMVITSVVGKVAIAFRVGRNSAFGADKLVKEGPHFVIAMSVIER